MRKGIALIAVVQAFWLLLNASLIIGLCQRQKLARTLELILTIVTTLAFIVMAPPFRMTLFEVSFFRQCDCDRAHLFGPMFTLVPGYDFVRSLRLLLRMRVGEMKAVVRRREDSTERRA